MATDTTSKSEPAELDPDEVKLVRRLKASIIRRAPMDAANLLTRQPDTIVSAVLQQTRQRITRKILRLLPEERSERLSHTLSDSISEYWEINLSYPEDTIGRLMEPTVGTMSGKTTVSVAVDQIRTLSEDEVVFTYVYVIDTEDRLLGVVVMRDLLFAEPQQTLEDIMIDDPFCFTADTPVQQAMLDVVHRHYPVYPVCDEEGILVGLVQGFELFEEHATEVSAQPGMMVGVDNEEHLATPIPVCFRYRHPWLQLNLLTAFLAAFVVGMFENTIQQVVVLAAFLPVLAGQSGNTGCQALAVTLRGMTLGEVKQGLERNLVFKELKLGAINGSLVGITAALGMMVYTWISGSESGLMLAFVVFLAMLGSCVASGIAGVLVPLILRRFGTDPVTASTIFLTTATDVLSMGLLLGLATILVL